MVDDRRLRDLLMTRNEPKRKVELLIAEANGRGGLDNITAIVVHVDEASAGPDRTTGEMPAVRE
jgi:protein phosphatase